MYKGSSGILGMLKSAPKSVRWLYWNCNTRAFLLVWWPRAGLKIAQSELDKDQ